MSVTNNNLTTRPQTFAYDSLNRLSTARTATCGANCWGLQYGYDRWANLLSATVTQGTATGLSVSVNSKNQVSSSPYAYDAVGNLTHDALHAYTYDAQSELTTMDGTAATYYYDAQGQRVQKANGNSYVYGLQDEVLAEYDSAMHLVSEYVYLGGRRIARRDASGAVYSYFADHLGTNRVMTNASGTTQQESDYEPFGVERPPLTNLVVNKYKFTGLERDTESGLDHASFRQYGSSFGRWLTPDPAGKGAVRLNDPQTWNMYAYVRNNPTTLTDPSGLDFYLTCKQTKDNPSTCQGGHVGTTDDKGKFTATVVTSASLQNRKSGVTGIVTEGGVKITTASGTYTGQFINGTPAATLQGSGVLAPFTFNITGQGSGNLLQGRWQFNGTAEQAANWMSSHGAWSYPVLDLFNKFHPNTQQYRLSDPNNPAGPSAHLSQPLGVTTGIGAYGIDLQTYPSASEGPFHVDVHGTLGGHIEDVWEAFTQ